jgi:hypothetical protein
MNMFVVVAMVCLTMTTTPAMAKQPASLFIAEVDYSVAVVDGLPVWQSEIDEAGPSSLAASTGLPLDSASLDSAIDMAFVDKAASELHIDVSDANVDSAIAQIAEHNKLSDAELLQAIKSSGISKDGFRVSIRRQMAAAIFFSQLQVVAISDQDVELAYQKLKQASGGKVLSDTPQTVRTRLIKESVEMARATWLQQRRSMSQIVVQPRLQSQSTKPPHVWTELNGVVKNIKLMPTTASGVSVSVVQQLVKSQIGKPLDRSELRRALQPLFAELGMASVHVVGSQANGAITLAVEVLDQPIVRSIAVKEKAGTVVAGSAKVQVMVGQRLRSALIAKHVDRLRSHYLKRGFATVSVSWSQKQVGHRQVDIVVAVDPGTSYSISAIGFTGNKHFTSDQLAKLITVAVGDTWKSDDINTAMWQLQSFYYDQGYVAVAITAPSPTLFTSPSHQAVPATFAITEGAQYHIGTVKITGVDAATAAAYHAVFRIEEGDVFCRSQLVAATQNMRSVHNATVDVSSTIDATKAKVDLLFTITAGK